MDGKGGWTFARIPASIRPNKKSAFHWTKVKGSIDGLLIKKHSVMPMGNGEWFLPINADIRKKIGKQSGAVAHIILYPDNDPMEIPDELQLCLLDEPEANTFFQSLTESNQKYYINWIYSAKRMETRMERLATTIVKLLRKEKLYGANGSIGR